MPNAISCEMEVPGMTFSIDLVPDRQTQVFMQSSSLLLCPATVIQPRQLDARSQSSGNNGNFKFVAQVFVIQRAIQHMRVHRGVGTDDVHRQLGF